MATKKKTARSRRKNTSKAEVKKIIKDERSHKIAGVLLILIALFLFIAFSSYLFTWNEDQSVVSRGAGIFFHDDAPVAQNVLGTAGAYFADLFFRRGFGIASYLFCLFLFVIGINLIAPKKVFSVWRNLRYVIGGLLLISLCASFLMHNVHPVTEPSNSNGAFFWGGRVGDMLNEWLQYLLGYVGTLLLIIVFIASYLIWRFNPAFAINREKFVIKNLFIGRIKQSNSQGDGNNFTTSSSSDDAGKMTFDVVEKEEKNPQPEIKESKPVVPFPNKINTGSGLTLEVKNANVLNKQTEASDEADPKPRVQEPYDPVIDLPSYKYPSLDLLETHGSDHIVQDASELENNKNKIEETLKNYDIGIQKIYATVGPTVTLYEIIPDPGVRISRIRNLEDDIALSLAALGIRIIAPIPGKGTIGIEVPNKNKTIVSMRTLLSSDKFKNNNFQLPIALGKRIDNENFIVDLTTMPHLLMAGATGQGKSVGLNAILVSLLYKKHPSQIKFVLIDPKKVELSIYTSIEKHFLAKLPGEEDAIITDIRKVIHTLNALCTLMDIRYDLMKEAGTRNIKEYNKKFVSRKLNPEKGHEYLPFIVLVIDEFADLIMTAGKEVEMPLARLAQLARAVGIHLIIATQRPSVNIITGTIKANFPARIAFKVSSKIDSRTILDIGGAEQLIGKGDMLISYNGELTRLQCAFVDTPEVDRVTNFIGEQRGYPEALPLPEYVDEKEFENKSIGVSERDPVFEDAARLIVRAQSGSTSLLQRKMKLGYNRAGRLMDQLEAANIVGPSQGSKPRDVLVKTEAELLNYLQAGI